MQQTGNIVAVAGLIVLLANHFGFNLLQSDAESVVGAVVVLYGLIHQSISHRNQLQAVVGGSRG